jgi:hypothetical protein
MKPALNGRLRKPNIFHHVDGRYPHWTRFAAEWIAWAATLSHDVFRSYRPVLPDFIGTGRGEALEVGCGEGRVSRVLRPDGT